MSKTKKISSRVIRKMKNQIARLVSSWYDLEATWQGETLVISGRSHDDDDCGFLTMLFPPRTKDELTPAEELAAERFQEAALECVLEDGVEEMVFSEELED